MPSVSGNVHIVSSMPGCVLCCAHCNVYCLSLRCLNIVLHCFQLRHKHTLGSASHYLSLFVYLKVLILRNYLIKLLQPKESEIFNFIINEYFMRYMSSCFCCMNCLEQWKFSTFFSLSSSTLGSRAL